MDPRNVTTPKAQNAKKEPISPNVAKKTTVIKKPKTKTPLKLNNANNEKRQRTPIVPSFATPRPKQNKTEPQQSGSVVKSIKKPEWKPKPAHSGVPVPEKMKWLGDALFRDLDCSL